MYIKFKMFKCLMFKIESYIFPTVTFNKLEYLMSKIYNKINVRVKSALHIKIFFW